MHQQKRSTYWFSYLVLENLPKGEELGGFLHGHPVTDETCDQAAGHREEEEEEEDGSEGRNNRSCFNFLHLIYFFPEWQFSDAVLLDLKSQIIGLISHCKVTWSDTPEQVKDGQVRVGCQSWNDKWKKHEQFTDQYRNRLIIQATQTFDYQNID